ncbi:MAG: glycosyltransferase family 2 protein [Hyphomicrobiales bacterium]|nr:glycosyltransferase family 2 protein [Hyphomicrobiales bacterium]
MRLSIAIPIYNFANFIGETLDSIVAQDGVGGVEIVVVDGASTDATPQVMADYCARHPQVRYVRLPQKGGIDRDMATAFASTSGDYCWLFSGDDIMRPGALRRALQEIESGCDVYLTKHMEFLHDRKVWDEWPVLEPNAPATFDLGDPAVRARYFAGAVNTEAFFSFMGGMINKRASWDRVPFNAAFDGSCWAHAARLFELMKLGLRLRYVPECWQDRRPDNDSFMGRGFVARIALSVDGYHKIADTFFGHESVEAFHVRRVIRREFGLGMLMMGKYACMLDPDGESRAQLDGIVRKAYCDRSWANFRMKLDYALTPPKRFAEWQPELAAKQVETARRRKAARQAQKR